MKKVYLLLFFFVFFQKSNAQVEPRLVEERFQVFNSSQNEYHTKESHLYEYDYLGNYSLKSRKVYDGQGVLYFWKDEFFQYNALNNIISRIIKYHDINGEVSSQSGVFFEYNSQNLVSKSLVRYYNPDVDLWTTIYWWEHYYDDNGCLIELIERKNSVLVDEKIFLYERDENCNKTREDFIPDPGAYTTFEHLDDYGSIIRTNYNSFDNQYYSEYSEAKIYNEYGDLIKFSALQQASSLDTTSFYFNDFYYDYLRDPSTNLLLTKSLIAYRTTLVPTLNPNNNPKLFYESTTDYEYYCDGTLAKEEISSPNLASVDRTLYFYEGKLDCVKLEEDLSITISPNPSQGQIEIQSALLTSGNTSLKVFATNGKLVIEKLIVSRQLKQEIDLGFLSGGLYILQLQNKDYLESSKLSVHN